MPPRNAAEQRRYLAAKVRARWLALSSWGRPADGVRPAVDFGRVPLRPAICDPGLAVEPRHTADLSAARARLAELVRGWPVSSPRLAIEGGTGLGKTTLAVERCADHVVGPRIVAGQILFVAHDRRRVEEIVARIRQVVVARGGDPRRVSDLLGRQAAPADSLSDTRFGCRDSERATRYGRRGRRVDVEVCGECASAKWCRSSGYLRHTEDAEAALVVVTTQAKLRGLAEPQWDAVGAVLGDEDILPGLFGEVRVWRGSLARARGYIDRLTRKLQRSPRQTAHVRLRPLVAAALEALERCKPSGGAMLVDLLPEDCERFATDDGRAELHAAMPLGWRRSAAGQPCVVPDPHAPADFEVRKGEKVPRQVWGRLLDALISDTAAGDSNRCGTVRVERGRRGAASLVIRRIDDRTLTMLRARPLLVLDATLHPAAPVLLAAERRVIDYDQGRTIIQVLGPLFRVEDLLAGPERLTNVGLRVVAKLAAWFNGRRGYVLARKSLVPVMRAEAARYQEMRQVEFTSPGRERGWDAAADASVFAVVGRHARPHAACEAEARALRSFMMRMLGSTELLDRIQVRRGPMLFSGRGRPLLFRGELVERVARRTSDPLADLLIDAHRVATIRQFVGRDRQCAGEILLLRGDPTIAADAAVHLDDLPEATPFAQLRQSGGRTLP